MRKKKCLAVNATLGEERPAWMLFAGLALVALLAGVVATSCGGGATGKESAEDPAEDAPQPGADLEHPSLGDENAPVVMTEYADYQ